MSRYGHGCLQPIEIPDTDDPDILVAALIKQGEEPWIARLAVDQRVRPSEVPKK